MPAIGPRHKWIALSNTTLGVLMATINSSIMLIALPNIFRDIVSGVSPPGPYREISVRHPGVSPIRFWFPSLW